MDTKNYLKLDSKSDIIFKKKSHVEFH